MGTTAESARPAGGADFSSTEPNAPQPPHLPNHFAVRNPHSLHTCWIAIFAMVESCPQGPTCMLRASRVMTRSRGARLVLPILFVTVFIDLVGFGIIIPFLAYYVESFGARAAVVGLLMSSYSLAQFLFAPVWGRLSDRIGRRPILLLGLTGSVVGFTLFGLAGTLWLLFVGRVLMGIFGATIPTAQAAVADVTAPQDRARGMGLLDAAIGLGFILGPALGGVLSNLSTVIRLPPFEKNPYALPCLASAALALAMLPLAASWSGIYACAFGLARGHGLSQPSVASLISRNAPPDTQGGALGVSQSAASLARVLGPAMGGALFQQVAPGAPYIVAAGLSLAAVVCARLRS